MESVLEQINRVRSPRGSGSSDTECRLSIAAAWRMLEETECITWSDKEQRVAEILMRRDDSELIEYLKDLTIYGLKVVISDIEVR